MPTVPNISCKGDINTGFVHIVDETTLLFPCFDGNGMWFSMGNIADHGKIGMLFINTVEPHRLRVHGTARLVRDPDVLARWKDVGLAVEVSLTRVWINCPRYIHPMEQRGQSCNTCPAMSAIPNPPNGSPWISSLTWCRPSPTKSKGLAQTADAAVGLWPGP